MAQYATLKAAIDAVIKANGQREITGTVLNQTLNAMVNSLGANYQFAGVATPSTNPGTPDQNVCYLAGQGGTYTNFNNIAIPNGISFLLWNGSWSSQTVLSGDGGVFDISAYKATGGTLATFADLSAALGENGANVPIKFGGMQVRFVSSSDNNYVQYFCTANEFTTDVTKWQGVDNKPIPRSNNLINGAGIFDAINESDYNKLYSFTKNGSTTYNETFPFTVEEDKYYKVKVISSNNKISNVSIIIPLASGFQIIKVKNNDYTIFKAQSSNYYLRVQNTETIEGTDDVSITVSHLESYADSLKLFYANIDFSIKSELIYSRDFSKSGSTTLNTLVNDSYSKNRTYVIEIKTTNKLISYINWVYQDNGYVVTKIPVKNGYGILSFSPTTDISTVIVQNTETIEGTDNITITSYDTSESGIYELIHKNFDGVSDIKEDIKDTKSEFVDVFSVTKTGSTVLNSLVNKNLSSDKIYTFNVESSGKITNLGIAYFTNNGWSAEIIPVYSGRGYYMIQFSEDITSFRIQNTETIEGNDSIKLSIYDSTKTKVYRIIKDNCLDKIDDVKRDINKSLKVYHYETGDYTSYNIIHVGVGYENEEPQLAINSISGASETNRYLIMLHGDFEVTDFNQLFDTSGNRCSREIVENGTTTAWSYIFTKDFVDIIGANRDVKIKFNLPIVNNNQRSYLHTIYDRGTTNIANLCIDVENSRYCIHQENGTNAMSGQDSSRVKLYRNLKMINRNSASFGYNPCFGIGTAPNQNVTFENCDCLSLHGNSINNIHSHSNYAYPFVYHFKNCRFDSVAGFDEVYYSDLYSGVKQSFIIEGCIFPSFGEKRQSYGFSLSLTDKAHDYRNGGAFISGHGNNFVMVRETAPCLVLETTTNNSNISAVSDDIVGDCLVSYEGTSDAHGVFVGTELIMSGNGSNVLNLGSRLGDCSTVNKSLIVTIDEVQQTVVFAENYSNVSDADIISYINSQLTGCTCYIGYDIQIPSFNDETVLAINNSSSTIEIGDLLVLDIANGYHSYKKCQDGDIVDAIATKRMNPGDSAYVITKYHQKFNNIGGMSEFTDGVYYQADNNGKIKVAANQSSASFRCIGGDVLEWVKN